LESPKDALVDPNNDSEQPVRSRKPPIECRLDIDYDNCAICAACTSVCHSRALIMDALTLELSPTLCDNCSVCIYVCPTGALSLAEEVANK
jgi:MinD superfamily P-loop ATPase